MRPIDADELLKKYEWLNWYSVSEKGRLMKGATSESNPLIYYHDGEELIKNAPTLDVAPAIDVGPKWISVKDKLPERYKRVLVAFKNGMVTISMRTFEQYTGVFGFLFESNYGPATYWMPLPEPPKES